jgi:hypothetical protein
MGFSYWEFLNWADFFVPAEWIRQNEQGVKSMVQAYKSPANENFGQIFTGPADPMRYSEILDWVSEHPEAFIGSSYYYIQADDRTSSLQKLTVTGSSLYSIGVVDHEQLSISDSDLDEAVQSAEEEPQIPHHYHISVLIERKLRAILDT